jgi:hypothetical protein
MNRKTFNQYLSESNFRELFITEMGWNNPTGATLLPEYVIDEKVFNIEQIADCRGFQILQCEVDEIPTSSVCKKLDTKLRKNAEHYICIFSVPDMLHHLWVTPVKKVEKRDLVLVEYDTIDKASFLFEKMEGLSFSFDAQPTIIDVIDRVQNAFIVNSEKITKDFYAGFKKEHTNFVKFISGIDDEIADKDNKKKQWYTSVMLNRLMFCYFIQKKGFLDDDKDYLRKKLEWTQKEKGENRFFSTFYKGFLVSLFHDGLNAPEHDAKFEETYGRIPYLNGGMFDIHQLENEYKGHDIADEAFISLFDFFDKWHWHLDDRMTATGKDINPDVLGYIFEQYINSRAEMGAYYTKEDITEYIGRNTIVPYLMEAMKRTNESFFEPSGEIWSFLKESGDKYIFDIIKKGHDKQIPQEIERGIDVQLPNLRERRRCWNDRTPSDFSVPTEIWRETIGRLQRYDSIKKKISEGEITSFNDFITYNLDIRQFVFDFLSKTPNAQFIEVFYNKLQNITILDPTCGSGAFLFAALNILEPLYEICISRMQEFHENNNELFVSQLNEIENKYRSNIQYFIYKSIILRNLYGVDIMVEAIEIAKLRLFLKMVAVVDVNKRDKNLGLDPLPDIDFNIRCGNTLVGYATENELERDLLEGDMFAIAEFRDKVHTEMNNVSTVYKRFKEVQLTQTENMVEFKKAKNELKVRLATLNNLLNQHMYSAIAIGSDYDEWLASHQPFHWLAEFYEIINDNNGFDVIIGNPPYVEYSKVRNKYKVRNYQTESCGNLYGYVIERSKRIINSDAYFSLIVPISMICTQRMECVQTLLSDQTLWLSNYSERPSKLFTGADVALTIFITCPGSQVLFNTGFTKWKAETREFLFKRVEYNIVTVRPRSYIIPKICSSLENNILNHLNSNRTLGSGFSNSATKNCLFYRIGGGRYWKIFTSFSPKFILNGVDSVSSRENHIYFDNNIDRDTTISVLSSSFFYWFFILTTNSRDLNPSDLNLFPFSLMEAQNRGLSDTFSNLSQLLMDEYKEKSVLKQKVSTKTGNIIYQEFYPRLSKSLLDKIDDILSNYYGFTEEELDFIVNYDIKYRMGDELSEE